MTFFQGELGQPVGGFPKKLQKIILKGRPALNERPGLLAESVDFNEVKKELAEKIGYEPKQDEVLSYLMYPQVFLDYQKHIINLAMLHYWTHQHFSKVYVWVKQSMYKSNAEKRLSFV